MYRKHAYQAGRAWLDTEQRFCSGIILIAGLGILATYTGYVIGQFKLAYPHVHNMADAGEVMLGAFGRELFGGAQILFLVFIMGSHVLTFSIMMNTVTGHGTCTIVFAIVGMIISLVLTMPRTLLKVSYMAIVSFISIVAAVFITMIGVGIEKPGKDIVEATVQTNLYKGFLAVTNIIFAYSGLSIQAACYHRNNSNAKHQAMSPFSPSSPNFTPPPSTPKRCSSFKAWTPRCTSS